MHSNSQINNTNITNNDNTVKSKEYGDVRKCNSPVDAVKAVNTNNPKIPEILIIQKSLTIPELLTS